MFSVGWLERWVEIGGSLGSGWNAVHINRGQGKLKLESLLFGPFTFSL